MEVDADPLLSFMRALWPQVIARAVVGAVFAAVAHSRRRVRRVCLLCYRGGYAGVAAVWLALRGDPPRLIAVLFTVLRTLGTEPQCALLLLLLLLLLLPLLLLLLLLLPLLLQQWSLVSPT